MKEAYILTEDSIILHYIYIKKCCQKFYNYIICYVIYGVTQYIYLEKGRKKIH